MQTANFSLDIKKTQPAMARQNYSVAELANAYGVSRARMNAILSQRYISYAVLGRMAAALKVDPEELLETEVVATSQQKGV